jgi:hypothetical protein
MLTVFEARQYMLESSQKQEKLPQRSLKHLGQMVLGSKLGQEVQKHS